MGRPATHTIAADASYRFDFAYNALGLLDDVTYPSGGTGSRFRIRHDYEAGRVTRIRNAEAGGASVLDAQCTGCRRASVLDETLGTAVRVISGFSPLTGNLEYRQSGKDGGNAIQDLAYDWEAAGNLASRRDLNQGLVEEFRYDGLDRLVQSRRNGAVNLELDYDPIGNIRRKSDVCTGAVPCYAYHATRRHAVTTAGDRTYAYDANGNMTSRERRGHCMERRQPARLDRRRRRQQQPVFLCARRSTAGGRLRGTAARRKQRSTRAACSRR